MSIPMDIVIRAVGAATAKTDIKGVAQEGVNLGNNLSTAATKAEALRGKLETIRNAGAGIAVAGASVLILSNHLTDAFLEADRLGGKMESMMKGKGLQDGIQQVKALANEIAGLTGGDDDQVATAIAGAIASGRLNALREYGIVIDAAGQAAIAAAGKISQQAKQQEILNQVLRAGGEAAKNLRDGMDESTAALGEMAVRWGNLEEGIGKGSARVKSALYSSVISPIFDLLESSPGLQATVGGILEIGGAAASVGGSVVGLTSQLAQTYLGYQSLKQAKIADTAATEANTLANAANARSLEAVQVAAATNTRALGMMSKGLSVLSALVIPAILIPIGTMIIDAVADHFGGKSGADSRADAIDTLRNNPNGVNIRAGRNKYKTESEQLEADAERLVFEGKMNPADADKKLLEEKLKLEKHYAEEFARFGAEKDAAEHRKKYNELQRQSALGAQAAVMPVFDPSAPSLDGGGAYTESDAMDDADAAEDEITDLQDQIRHTKGKDAKAALKEQLIQTQRRAKAIRENNAAEKKAAEKAERDAKKRADALAKLEREELEYSQLEAGLKGTEAEEQFNTRLEQLQAQRDDAREAKDVAREKQLAYQIATLQADRDLALAQIRADATALEDERRADIMRREAQIKHRGALQRALNEFNRPSKNTGANIGALLRRLTTNRPSGSVTGPFNPYANHDSGVFATQYTGNSVYRDIPQNLGPTQPLPSTMKAKQIGSYELANGGKRLLFEVMLPNFLRQDTATIPGG